MFNDKQIADLIAPLNSQHVRERAQLGRKLSYIEGWHSIAEANRIFGFDQWKRETLELRLVAEKARTIGQQKRDGYSVSYIARVRITVGDSLVRDGTGAGHGIDADLGLAHESAIKEAETDAMKRALMTFGNPFGLALYDKTQANVCDDIPSSPAIQPAKAGGGGSPALPPVTKTAPQGINQDLWETAYNRASGGIEAYRAFWTNDASTSEKALLGSYHEALKAFAARQDARA